MRQASRERSGAGVAEQLRERRVEIEQAILARVYAVSEPPSTSGPEYTEGLRASVSAALDYGLEGIARGEQSTPAVPDILLAQARLAARSGVSLDTVLRRYFAGYTLLEDFLVEEAEGELAPAALKRLLRCQAAIVDRLLALVSSAYTEEAQRKPQGAGRRRAEQVERLLAGESLDAAGLGYDLEGHHLGILASGPGAEESIGALAKALECRPLLLPREEGVLWGWLGSRHRLDPQDLENHFSRGLPPELSLAIGEPGRGTAGWRLSHHQARAALSVALRSGEALVRYADVALLASMLRDDLLLASLRSLFLAPLEAEADGGKALRATLRAYFACERNVSSTAAAMRLNRRTVTRRLRKVEEALDRPLGASATQLEAALRLQQLDRASPH